MAVGANATRDMEAFVRDYWIPGVVDQIGEMSVLLKLLTPSDGIITSNGAKQFSLMRMGGGGDKVRKSLRVERSAAHASIWGYDTVPTDPNRQFDYVQFTYRMYAASLPQAFTEQLEAASGPQAINSWMEEHLRAVISDHIHYMAIGLYNSAAARTGAIQGKGFNGLRELANIDRTWGNIDSTTYTWWDAGFYDATAYAEADLLDPNSGNYLLDKIVSLIDGCRHGGKGLTHILTSHYIYNLLEKILEEKRTLRIGEDGRIGVEAISYRGVKIMAEESDYFPDDYHMFGLRIEDGPDAPLGLIGRQGAWFHMTDWKEPTNQLARVKQIVSQAVLYCDQPRLFGAYTGLGNG